MIQQPYKSGISTRKVSLQDQAHIFIMVLCPLYFFQQVTEVTLEGNIVFIGLQLLVEVFIVRGVLLQYQGVTRQKVRKAIRCHSAIYAHLILVLHRVSHVK